MIVRAGQYDGNGRKFLADIADELHAVHMRHVKITNDKINCRRALAQRVQSFAAVFSFNNGIDAQILQQASQGASLERMIVGNQNLHGDMRVMGDQVDLSVYVPPR